MRNKIYQILKSNRWKIFFGRINPSVGKLLDLFDTRYTVLNKTILLLEDRVYESDIVRADSVSKLREAARLLSANAPVHPGLIDRHNQQIKAIEEVIKTLRG